MPGTANPTVKTNVEMEQISEVYALQVLLWLDFAVSLTVLL